MRIFDINNIEMTNPDLSKGYLTTDRLFVKHHDAIKKVDEKWHYEVVAEYPNGGKDIKKVIDIVGVNPKDAWDEYEEIYRYNKYPEDESNKESESESLTIHQRLDKIEEAILKLTKYFENHQRDYSSKDGD